MTQERLLDKLSKLKRHAESAKAIGSEAEAQAFAEKLQSLLLEHDLSLSDLEFEKMEEDPIERAWVDLNTHGLKVKKSRIAWMERLAIVVARANFCRVIVKSNTNNFWLVGRSDHRAVAEYMIVTLTRAIIDISKSEHGKYAYECYKQYGSTFRARGFKESFITAFLVRLFERLEERKKTAAASTSTALMRISKEDEAIEEDMKERRASGDTRKANSLTIYAPSSREGVIRGRAAAEKINLDGKAIGKGEQAMRSIGTSYFMVRFVETKKFLGREFMGATLGPVPRQFGSTFEDRAKAIDTGTLTYAVTEVIKIEMPDRESVVWRSDDPENEHITGHGRF